MNDDKNILSRPGCSSLCGNKSIGILSIKSGEIKIPICSECLALLSSADKNRFFEYLPYDDSPYEELNNDT